MSQENLETIQRVYVGVAAHLELPRDLFDPGLEVDATEVSLDFREVVCGLDAAQDALREYWETFEDFHTDIEEVIHVAREQVVVAVRDGGKVRGSDAEVRNRLVHVWTFGHGKIVHLSIHTDRSRALAAAGLKA